MNMKCPKCDGDMSLNVITNTWDCSKCAFQLDNKNIDNEKQKQSDGKYVLNHCDICNISFVGENIDNCFVCNGNLSKSNTDLEYVSFIDFKLDLEDAIYNYKKRMFYKLLSPIRFKRKKNTKRIKGVYIPMYLFDTSIDGEVVFNASDINVLDTNKKEKTVNYYKIVCNGHFDYEKVLINGSTKYKNTLLEKIDDYDFSQLKDIKELDLKENIIYKEDCDSLNVFDRLKNRCMNSSVKLMSELVKHTKNKVVDNKLDFKHDGKGIILVPVYILENKYKNKSYYYIMNGQNGNTYLKAPIGIIETIVFSVLLFTVSFVIMLLIALFL